jgi:hypothetical protein
LSRGKEVITIRKPFVTLQVSQFAGALVFAVLRMFSTVVQLQPKGALMPSNLHTEPFPAEELNELRQLLARAVEIARPRAIPRTPDERRHMLTLGPKSLSFMQRTLEHAINNPQICPPFLDLEDFKADAADAVGLREIRIILQQLVDYISDTEMVASSESYRSGLLVYSSSKIAAAQDVPGAKAVYNDLKTRFPRSRRAKSSDDSTPSTSETPA